MRGGVIVAVLSSAHRAWAAGESVCEGADVRIEGQPDPQWNDALGRLCGDLRAMKDRDPDAALQLSASESDLIVEVTLADGRSAMRRVKRPFALREVLDALLTLPPSPSPPPPPPVVAPPTPSQPPPPPPREEPRPPINAELALSAVGRVAGAGGLSAGGVAEGYLTTGRWLFGLYARWDAFQRADAPKAFDYEIETVGVGIAVARQLAFGPMELDVGFSPRLLVETESFELPAPEDDEDDRDRSTTDVRLAPFARALFGRAPLRLYVGLDAELSPARLRRKVRSAPLLPALPAWSAGLSAGVSWTTP